MFKIGDKVEVLDEGLAMLRKVCPDMGPNHHGIVLDDAGHKLAKTTALYTMVLS